MNTNTIQLHTQKYALLAGLIYLIIAVIGGFSIGYMPMEIVVEGDAAATLKNLQSNTSLFKWAIAGDITVIILEVILTVMIFQLFKTANSTSIRIATYARMAMAIIMGVNLTFYMIPSIILGQATYMNAFTPEALEALTLLFFKVHHYGVLAWQIFFAIHLFALGYVLRNSTFTPKWLGLIMLIGSFGYGGDCITQLLFLDIEWITTVFNILLVLAVISEFWFAFWLVFKGKNIQTN